MKSVFRASIVGMFAACFSFARELGLHSEFGYLGAPLMLFTLRIIAMIKSHSITSSPENTPQAISPVLAFLRLT
jgi:hypothetical protein